VKSYKAAEWQRADREWSSGGFSSEWEPWRVLARTEGTILFPPEGSALDSWEDDFPSQRAVLVRAMRETPDLLRHSIRGARSWGQVIERLFAVRDRWRRINGIDPDGGVTHGPSRTEAVQSLREILGRIRA